VASIFYYIMQAIPVALFLGLIYLIWYGISTKDYDVIFGIGLLTVFPLSIFLINAYPLPAAILVYAIWFAVNYSGNRKSESINKISIGSVAIKSLKYTAVTLVIALVISAVLGGGVGSGSCSRSTPQFC